MKDFYKINKLISNNKSIAENKQIDKKAIDSYIENEINVKYKKENNFFKFIVLNIKEKYYNKKLLELFSEKEFNELRRYAEKFNYKFKSFTSIERFYSKNVVKSYDRNRFIENFDDRVTIFSAWTSEGNFTLAKKIIKLIMTDIFQPSTASFQEAGRNNPGGMSSCFIININDNLEDIIKTIGKAMNLSKLGSSVSIDLSNLRSRSERVQGVINQSSGIIPILKMMENTFSYINKLDERKSAGVAWLSIFHGDIIEFLDSKKINADEKNRIQNLSLGVKIPNIFFDLAKENKEIAIFKVKKVSDSISGNFDSIDWDKDYTILSKNKKNIKKWVNARELLLKISRTQIESGYPYIMFETNVRNSHSLENISSITSTNLCTEILQIIDNDELTIGCNVGSLNINSFSKLKTKKEMFDVVHTSNLILNSITNGKLIENKIIKKSNNKYNAIALSIMDFHGYLILNNIKYGSPESISHLSNLLETVNYFSLLSSNKIAKEKGSFVNFKKTDYYSGEYFDKYLYNDIKKPKFMPTYDEWKELKNNVKKYGIYNGYRMAIPPNQQSSYIQYATPSIMPINSKIEKRTYGDHSSMYISPHIDDINLNKVKTGFEIKQEDIISTVSAAQRHIDQGISMTLFVDSKTSTRDISKLHIQSMRSGIKTSYYLRVKNLKLNKSIY